ncbi:universal stress protein [Nocardia asteroides]|uniref:universal stress protein n=1 Tax=Nocardia asteroides TaxID=1824 RepID=UPI003447E8A8
MTALRDKPIIVGIDGSDHALSAVRWAAEEATLHNAPLRLVHGIGTGWDLGPRVGEIRLHNQRYRDEGAAMLTEAERVARQVIGSGTTEISTELAWPTPVSVLVKRSHAARLLVLGTRRMHAFDRAVLGSVSAVLVRRAGCPVVVVPAARTPARSQPILVGVDGSPASVRAVDIAVEEAAARDVDVVALLAWRRTDERESGHAAAQRARAVLSAGLAGYAETHPQVRIRRTVADGDPVRRILDESAGTQLIVVGSRGRGGRTGFALGSVCRAVLDEATVPVLVARPRPGDRKYSHGIERRASRDRRLDSSHETKGSNPWSRSFWSTITKSSGTA